MPALNPDIISAAFKSLPTNFLSSLTSALDGDATTGNNGFSGLLSQIALAEKQATPPSTTDTQNISTSAPLTSMAASSTAAAFPDTSALKRVLNYVRSQEEAAQSNSKPQPKASSANTSNTTHNSNASSANVSSNNASSANTSATNTSTTTPSTSTDTIDDTDSSSDTSSNTTNPNNQPPDPATLALALTEMQQLLQWLAQHLSSNLPAAGAVSSAATITGALSPDPSTGAASGAASGTASGAGQNSTPTQATTQTGAQSTDPTQGSSAAGGTDSATQLADALAGFLALLQTIETQLMTSTQAKAPALTGATAATGAATTTAATNASSTNTTPDLSPYAQIKAGLEKLEAALEYEITGNAKLAAHDGASSDASNNSNPGPLSSSASSSTESTTKTTSIDDLMASINPASPTDAHLFKLFADIFGNTTQAAVATASNNLAVTAGNTGGADVNSDQDGNNNAAASNTPSVSNDASSLAAGTQQTNNLSSFANQLSAARANSTSTGTPQQILDQVILSMRSGIKNGDSQMTIQLSPGDLGRINVKLDISSEGKVQGTIVADNQSTLDQLLKDVRSLERALQDAGLSADPGSLQFSLGNQQQPGNTFAQSQSSGSGSNSNSDGSSVDPLSGDAVSIPTDAELYYITPDGVNIKV